MYEPVSTATIQPWLFSIHDEEALPRVDRKKDSYSNDSYEM